MDLHAATPSDLPALETRVERLCAEEASKHPDLSKCAFRCRFADDNKELTITAFRQGKFASRTWIPVNEAFLDAIHDYVEYLAGRRVGSMPDGEENRPATMEGVARSAREVLDGMGRRDVVVDTCEEILHLILPYDSFNELSVSLFNELPISAVARGSFVNMRTMLAREIPRLVADLDERARTVSAALPCAACEGDLPATCRVCGGM